MKNSQSRPGTSCGCLTILLIIFLGYSVVRYQLDKNYNDLGYQAYQKAECIEAIAYFNRIVRGWRIVDINSFSYFAEQRKAECLLLEGAIIEQQNGNYSAALVSFNDLVSSYNDSELLGVVQDGVQSILEITDISTLASQDLCESIDTLINHELIPQPKENLPVLIMSCGQYYDSFENYQASFNLYSILLTEFPDHPGALEIETSLIDNPVSCQEIDSLIDNKVIANPVDFLPLLNFQCGQISEAIQDFADAIRWYESFLGNYPNHYLSQDVEAALARSLVAKANAEGAGDLPSPSRRGSAGSDSVEVTIQNDSPEELRIVFSGPEANIADLAACESCNTYFGIGPIYCPEKGPVGRYVLTPGQYDVLVEASSSRGVTPFTGSWNLSSSQYYSCFFIVTSFGP